MQNGTPVFMAPEMLLGSKYYDCKVDIWALGLLFLELLTQSAPGVPPFRGMLFQGSTPYH